MGGEYEKVPITEETYRADNNWAYVDPKDKETNFRDVKVYDRRDLNELLRLPNPLKPSMEMHLVQVTLDSGEVIDRPTIRDLKALRPTKVRPVTLKWKDAKNRPPPPSKYDEIIQRLLNSSPSDVEELVRANWQKFDKVFFYRIFELKEDTKDQRLRERLENLEKFCMDIIQAAREVTEKKVPQDLDDVQELLKSMLEEDGQTLLWPAPPASYKRLAETITKLATRANYENGWFENILENLERFGKKMQDKDDHVHFALAKVVMQRLVTEWLRHDDLWEETKEGQFLYRLMDISHEQWGDQLSFEKEPLAPEKIRDELKIISETKIVKLPMASKLQVYAAKYINGLVEFAKLMAEKIDQGTPETQPFTAR